MTIASTTARVTASLLVGAALCTAPLVSQPPARSFSTAWAPVREFFRTTLASEGMVGGSLAFFHGDSILAREYFGYADLATKRRVDERTATSWSQLVAMMPYTEVLFLPGSKFSYSNPGYIYLGRTLEALTGDDYQVYVEKNVLRPIGMSSSYFNNTPYHLLPDRSNNYDMIDSLPKARGLDFDTGITVANGGLNAPVGDMVRYLQFLVGAPGVTSNARSVLSRASLEEMWRPVVPVQAGSRDSVGLGFFLIERGGLRLVGHTGSQAAFRAFFYIDPVTKTGVVAAFNTAPADDPRNPTNSVEGKPRIGLIFDGLIERMRASVFPLYRR